MRPRLIIFLVVSISFLILSAQLISRVISEAAAPPLAKVLPWLSTAQVNGLIAGLIYVLMICQILGPIFYRMIPDRGNRYFIFRWFLFACMGLASSLILYFMIVGGVLLVFTWIFPAYQLYLLNASVFVTLALVVITNVVGMIQVVAGPKIYNVNIPVDGSHRFMVGFKIALISDLHVGPTISQRYAAKVVSLVNSFDVDLVALTGDLIDGKVDDLAAGVAPLKNLKSRYGSFVVLGNHEFYWDAKAWSIAYEKLGLHVLSNDHRHFEIGSGTLLVAGVPDKKASRMINLSSDPAKALLNTSSESYKVLLAHQPTSAIEAEQVGFQLQLSGHTHGGQFFPFSLLVPLVEPYVKGLYKIKNMFLYVSRGTGYWGPPIRFLVPGEVTVITFL